MDTAVSAAKELADGGAVLVGADSCADCFVYLGLDPSMAGPAAVLLVAVLRIGFEMWSRRKRDAKVAA